jgi:hypothetical protein
MRFLTPERKPKGGLRFGKGECSCKESPFGVFQVSYRTNGTMAKSDVNYCGNCGTVKGEI